MAAIEREGAPKEKPMPHLVVVVDASQLDKPAHALARGLKEIFYAASPSTKFITVQVPLPVTSATYGQCAEILTELTPYLAQSNTRFKNISPEVPSDVSEVFSKLEEETKDNTGITFSLGIGYEERSRVVAGVRKIIERKMPAEAVDEKTIANNLPHSELPDADYILYLGIPRTDPPRLPLSGLIWRINYAELGSTPKDLFSLGPKDARTALKEYQERDRRHGGTNTKTLPARTK